MNLRIWRLINILIDRADKEDQKTSFIAKLEILGISDCLLLTDLNDN